MKNTKFDIFKPDNKISLKKGRLLISEPLSNDIFFSRTVVLLTEYSEKETMGFVLNKSSEYKLSDVVNESFKFNPKLNYGGPVGVDTLHFIHKLGGKIPGTVEVLPDLFWGGDFDIIKLMLKEGTITDNDIRFFIGYSGWSPNQLEDEVSNDFWLITEHSGNIAMEFRNKNDWSGLLNSLGDKYKHWSNVPENPSLN